MRTRISAEPSSLSIHAAPTSGVRRAAQITARATISSGDTLMSAKSGDALSRLTSSIVRVASTSVHTDTCGAVYAERTMADEVALRTPLTGIVSSRSPAGGADGADTDAGACETGIVCSRTAGAAGVAMLRKTLACSACVTTSSRVTSPAGPLGVTCARSTPRSRASLRTGGLATTPTDALTAALRPAAPRAARGVRREATAPPVP